MKIDGRGISRGKDFRYGYRRNLEGDDLVIWVRKSSIKPVRIKIIAE